MTKQMIFDKPQAVAAFPFEPIGNSTMNAASAPVAQSATLTSDGVNVSALESVSLGSYSGQMYVYTFVAALTNPAVPFEVKIGATAAETLDNLKAAVNLTGIAGDVWSEGTTQHPDIEATTNADTTQVFAARIAGYVGVLDVTETSQHLSFGVTTMSGAAGRIALSNGPTLIVRNTGHKDAYIKLGSSTVTASTSDYPVAAGATDVLYRDPAYTHLSAVCAVGETTTLSVSTGNGQPNIVASNEVTLGDVTVSNVEISNDVGNPIPVNGTVAVGAGTASIGAVASNSVLSSATVTRPADTTAYAAKDVISTAVGAVIEFSGMARANGGTGTIVKARLMTNQSTNTAQYRLHLFHTAPTAIADNAPYAMLDANKDKRIGMIDFPAAATEGTGSDAAASMRPSSDGSYPPPNLWYKCAANDTKLYGILETLSAFTPASAGTFFIELGADGLS